MLLYSGKVLVSLHYKSIGWCMYEWSVYGCMHGHV